MNRLFNSDGDPIVTTIAIQKKLFYSAGILMAQSFLQGGPTPNVLSKNSFKVVSLKDTVYFELQDFPEAFKNEIPIKAVCFFFKSIFIFIL